MEHGPNWLVCAPLGIHFEPINVNAVSDNIIMCHLAQRENFTLPNKKFIRPMVHHDSSSKTLIYIYIYIYILSDTINYIC